MARVAFMERGHAATTIWSTICTPPEHQTFCFYKRLNPRNQLRAACRSSPSFQFHPPSTSSLRLASCVRVHVTQRSHWKRVLTFESRVRVNVGGQPHPNWVFIDGELVKDWHAWQCTDPVHDRLDSWRHGFNGLVDVHVPGLHWSAIQSGQGELLSQTQCSASALQQSDAYLTAGSDLIPGPDAELSISPST